MASVKSLLEILSPEANWFTPTEKVPCTPLPVPTMLATESSELVDLYRLKPSMVDRAAALSFNVESCDFSCPKAERVVLALSCFFWMLVTFCCSMLTKLSIMELVSIPDANPPTANVPALLMKVSSSSNIGQSRSFLLPFPRKGLQEWLTGSPVSHFECWLCIGVF